jgi:glycosyltransferase involved in cell wall biosynthesis
MQEVVTYNTADKDSLWEGEKPLVSVVIPSRNHIKKLQKALESVIRQTYNNYEVIVIDDASSDGTSSWVKTHYPDIQLIRLSRQCGAAGARNKALKIAKGKFIAFLDSDDEWFPEYLQVQITALLHTPASALSFCEIINIETDGNQRKIIYVPNPGYPSLIHRLLAESSFILTMSAAVIRTNELQKTGFLNERLRITHDRELYIRLLQLGSNITYIPETLIVKHAHESNISSDFYSWAKDAMLLLDIFFSNKKNQQYRQVETTARREIIIGLFNYLSNSNLGLLSKSKSALTLCTYLLRFRKCVKSDIHNFLTKKKNR